MGREFKQPDPFVADVVLGRNPTASPLRIEKLLDWIVAHPQESSRPQCQSESSDRAQPGGHQIFVYLKRTLFSRGSDPYRVLGLRPSCDERTIRARYKRLLQVFHPDRHTQDAEWFTQCTEQINQAYTYLKLNHGKAHSEAMNHHARCGDVNAVRPAGSSPLDDSELDQSYVRKARLRRNLQLWLGSPGRLQHRIYLALGIIPVIMLIMVYLSKPAVTFPRNSVIEPDFSKQGPVAADQLPVNPENNTRG